MKSHPHLRLVVSRRPNTMLSQLLWLSPWYLALLWLSPWLFQSHPKPHLIWPLPPLA